MAVNKDVACEGGSYVCRSAMACDHDCTSSVRRARGSGALFNSLLMAGWSRCPPERRKEPLPAARLIVVHEVMRAPICARSWKIDMFFRVHSRCIHPAHYGVGRRVFRADRWV